MAVNDSVMQGFLLGGVIIFARAIQSIYGAALMGTRARAKPIQEKSSAWVYTMVAHQLFPSTHVSALANSHHLLLVFLEKCHAHGVGHSAIHERATYTYAAAIRRKLDYGCPCSDAWPALLCNGSAQCLSDLVRLDCRAELAHQRPLSRRQSLQQLPAMHSVGKLANNAGRGS